MTKNITVACIACGYAIATSSAIAMFKYEDTLEESDLLLDEFSHAIFTFAICLGILVAVFPVILLVVRLVFRTVKVRKV